MSLKRKRAIDEDNNEELVESLDDSGERLITLKTHAYKTHDTVTAFATKPTYETTLTFTQARVSKVLEEFLTSDVHETVMVLNYIGKDELKMITEWMRGGTCTFNTLSSVQLAQLVNACFFLDVPLFHDACVAMAQAFQKM